MKNTRTLISSSIVSIVIMVLGMFMLCMSRAPKISFDEPLIEGGGVEYDSVDVNDDDFLSLLDEESANNDMTFAEDNSESATPNDEDFLSLLDEVEEGTTTYDQTSESGDEGLDEILSLLELDENAESENLSKDDNAEVVSDSDDDWLQALTEEESAETATQTSQSDYSEMESVDQLSQEVEQLENVLAEKNTTAENLQAEIDQYDQQFTQSQRQNPVAVENRAPLQPASYYEPTPAAEETYNTDANVNRAYTSDSFDGAYNAALDQFQNHQYPQAINSFYQLLLQNSRHPLADNCQYWIGECRYAQGKYYQAVAEFNKVFAYDAPDKQDDAQLMLGLTYLKLGELGSARIEFDWLVSCYASSEYVNTANRYLGQF